MSKRVKKIPSIVVKALLQLVDHSEARLEYGGPIRLGKDDDEYVDSIKILLTSKQKFNSKGAIESYIELPDEIAVFHTHPRNRIAISGHDLLTAVKRHPAFVNKHGNACGKTEVNIIITSAGVWIFKLSKRMIKKILVGLKTKDGQTLTIRSPEMLNLLNNTITKPVDSWSEQVMLHKMTINQFQNAIKKLGFTSKFIPITDLDEIDISEFLIENDLDDLKEACITFHKDNLLPSGFKLKSP